MPIHAPNIIVFGGFDP